MATGPLPGVPLEGKAPPSPPSAATPPPSPPSPPRHSYLPHLDGLRAVAVTAVLLYHWGVPPFCTGGFVGVDIFFVLSGYLVTRTTAAALAAEPLPGGGGRQPLSLRAWYGRRFWRLAPAAVATTTATLAAAYVWLPPDVAAGTARAALAAAGGGANLYYGAAAGYFDGAAGSKPLLHTWSLSVEEQFYGLWAPALFWLARRRRQREGGAGGQGGEKAFPRDTVTLAIVGGSTAASLVAALATVSATPVAAWYGLHTRGWEFGAGVAAALWSPPRALLGGPPQPPSARVEATAVLCLSALVAAAIFLDGRTVPWPGVATVPVVAATVAVILTPTSRVARRALSHPAARLLGRVSYSAYLVHWPVWVVLHYALPPAVLASAAGGGRLPLAAAALTAALTTLQYLAVECPLRTPTGGGKARGGGRGGAAGDGSDGPSSSGAPPVTPAPLLPKAVVTAAAASPRAVPSHRTKVMLTMAVPGITLVATALATDGWVGRTGPPPPGATDLAIHYQVPPVPSIDLCEVPPPAGYTFPGNVTAFARHVCGVGAPPPQRRRQGGGGHRTPPPSPPRLALVLGDSFAGMRRPTAAAAGRLAGGRLHFSWTAACPPLVGMPYAELAARLPAVGRAAPRLRRSCSTAHTVWRTMLAGGYTPPTGKVVRKGGGAGPARPMARRAAAAEAAGGRRAGATRAAAPSSASAAAAAAAAANASTVILSGYWPLYFRDAHRTGVDADGPGGMAPLFSATVAALRAAGARRVLVIGAPPLPAYDAEACVAAPTWRRRGGSGGGEGGGACPATAPVNRRAARFNALLGEVVGRIPGAFYVDVFPATCGGRGAGRVADAVRTAGRGSSMAGLTGGAGGDTTATPLPGAPAPPPGGGRGAAGGRCAQLWRGAPVYHGKHLTRAGALLEVPLWVVALGGDAAGAEVAVPGEKRGG